MEKYTAIQSRVVWPCYLNDRGNLFGGEAMKWMDEVAYITAQRYTPRDVVTVSVDNIRFLKPLKMGDVANVVGRVVDAGPVKLTIRVEIHKEIPHSGTTEKSLEATFIFAAVDENERPVRL
mgnify:CR=1 FL=1